MHDPTVELSQKDERDWRAERQEEIAAICWQKCEECNGYGHHKEYWPADDGGPDYVLRPGCLGCEGQGHIQLHDPQRVAALYDAADDARERLGVWCYTRIISALTLAIEGAVDVDESNTMLVASQSVEGKKYLISKAYGCNCYDACHRAPWINHLPHCKHQIAVWLVNTAEEKMVADTQFIREEKGYG